MSYEIEWVERAIKGDEKAFLQLMNLFKIDLYRTALSYLKNENEAIEAVQEVTYRAYKNIRNVRKKEYFKTWLIRIMINYCNDELKKKKRVITNVEMMVRAKHEDSFLQMEMYDVLNQLDERTREVLTLMYFQDFTIKEIALVMARPEGTIKTWLHKGLVTLREILSERSESKYVE